MEIITKINQYLHQDDIKRLRLIVSYLNNNMITLEKITKYLKQFLHLLINEKLFHTYKFIQETRIWIITNIIRCLNNLLIDPTASPSECDYIKQYSYILDVFVNLTHFMNTDTHKTYWLLRHFFTIDIDIRKQCDSKYDCITYIMETMETDSYAKDHLS